MTGAEGEEPTPRPEHEVEVMGVFTSDEDNQRAFVLLRDAANRSVPIAIGPCEALAIQMVLQKTAPPRPMTHDLIHNVLERLQATLDRVVIDDLSNQTFYCTLCLSRNGEALRVDSRPSDAIAIALRCNSPIFVSEDVLSEASIDEEPPPDADIEPDEPGDDEPV